MAFILSTAKKARVTVKGNRSDEEGNRTKYDFTLICKRYRRSEVKAKLKLNEDIEDFMKDVTLGWTGVNAADKQPLEFSEENFALIMDDCDVAAIAFQAYLLEIGYVIKN